MTQDVMNQKTHPKSVNRQSGERLRTLLHECSISPMAFSEFLNVSPQCLNNWFMRGIPKRRIAEIAGLLSVNDVWLATGAVPALIVANQKQKCSTR